MRIPKNTPNYILAYMLEDFTSFYYRYELKLNNKINKRKSYSANDINFDVNLTNQSVDYD